MLAFLLAQQKVAVPIRERGAGRDSTGDDEVLPPHQPPGLSCEV